MQKIKEDFDRLALYDRSGWDHNNHYHSFLLKQLPKKRNTVLDIGCGTGEFARLLAQRFNKVVALDLSPNTIDVAKKRSQDYKNIDFQLADIMQWQFPSFYFDAIISIATFHHVSVENLLPNLQNALKPGGKLIILDLLEQENIGDFFNDFIAVPLNWLFSFKNRHIQPSPAAIAAMREHLRTDKFLTFSQVKQIYLNSLHQAEIKKHLFWRYSLVWQKPISK